MDHQATPVIDSILESNLRERMREALRYIASVSQDDVLRCDDACLAEIVRQFAAVPPLLRLESIVVDEKVVELEDIMSQRKTGHTGHYFFIPVERGAEWLDGVSRQKVDDCPLAFLDKESNRIRIPLTIGPEHGEGELKRQQEHRTELIRQYAHWVAVQIMSFNKDLAEKMLVDWDKRKKALTRAEKELSNTGFLRIYNPEHAEMKVRAQRLLLGLGTYLKEGSEPGQEKEVRSFIVHGHDHQSLFELKDFLQNRLKLDEPVVLRQMPGLGKTLIEKFEKASESVQLVFVLLTPDDSVVDVNGVTSQKRRSRQNVILELGFFLGKLGRSSGRILLLHKGKIEIPSDIVGIEYIDITHGIESAGESIRRELQALGVI